MQILYTSLKKDLYMQTGAGFFMTIFSSFLAYRYFADNIILSVLGLVGFVLGLRFFIDSVRQLSINNNQLLILLDQYPEQIVWVYALNTVRMPFGFELFESGILYFKMEDGEEISISLPAEKLKVVSRFLNRILPNTTFGFTPEREELYQKSPSSLSLKKEE